jgi:Zn-dependent protease
VDFSRLRHPKRDMVWVALAGPAINLLQAFAWVVLYYLLTSLGSEEQFFFEMVKAGLKVNLAMFAFNLFPLPPLDGGRIVTGLLPMRLAIGFSHIERYGFFIVMGLVLMGVINSLWMGPIMATTFEGIQWVLQPLAALLQLTP